MIPGRDASPAGPEVRKSRKCCEAPNDDADVGVVLDEIF